MRHSVVLVLAFVLALVAHIAGAQNVSTVPLGDPAYRAIDRLAADGLLDSAVLGSRPFSRRQFARLIASARLRLARDQGGPVPIRRLQRHALELRALEARFASSSSAEKPAKLHAYTQYVAVGASAMRGEPRRVPPDTGFGGTDAYIAPLVLGAGGLEGRDVLGGSTLALESSHVVAIGSRIAAFATPQLRVASQPSRLEERTFTLRSAGIRLRVANAVLSAGRQGVEWGSGRRAGLFLSNNAQPLNMIGIGSDAPFHLPWIFRHLGPNTASLVAADLGPAQHFPHTKMIGYKWNAAPRPDLEIGWSVLDFVGGHGAPPASFGRRVANLFLGAVLPVEGFNFSNQMMGGEVRYRAQRLNGTTFYLESNLDEFDSYLHRIWKSVWTEDGAHTFGAIVPIGDGLRAASIGGEVRHTGTRFNRHAQFRSGPTVRRILLGEPLGPDAQGASLFAEWSPRPSATVTVDVARETYRSDQYRNTSSPYRVYLLERRPVERRHRAVVTVRGGDGGIGGAVSISAGVERVTNFDFTPGASRAQALLSASMRRTFR